MVHDPGGKELKIAIAVTGAFFLLELVDLGGFAKIQLENVDVLIKVHEDGEVDPQE